MGDACGGDRESVVMGGGGACVGSRGVSERDYCSIPGLSKIQLPILSRFSFQ